MWGECVWAPPHPYPKIAAAHTTQSVYTATGLLLVTLVHVLVIAVESRAWDSVSGVVRECCFGSLSPLLSPKMGPAAAALGRLVHEQCTTCLLRCQRGGDDEAAADAIYDFLLVSCMRFDNNLQFCCVCSTSATGCPRLLHHRAWLCCCLHPFLNASGPLLQQQQQAGRGGVDRAYRGGGTVGAPSALP